MKRISIALVLLMLASLACSLDGLVPGDPVDRPIGFEETEQVVAATFNARATLDAQATIDAAAQEQATGNFCEIYAEFVIDLESRVAEYERVIDGGGDGDSLALAADESIEVYMDRLAPIAPDEVRAEVELLANMSLIGLLSSQEVFPEAELALSYVDDYATDNCSVSFGE